MSMNRIVKTCLPTILAVLVVAGAAWAQDPAAQDPAAQDPAAQDPAAQEPAAQEPAVGGVEASLAFGTGVDRDTRSLTGESAGFAADVGKVFCLARITGMGEPGEVTFAWYQNGKTIVKVPLQVRSADYRTWSSKSILPGWTGPWEVKLLDAAGRVLASAGFTVE